MDFSSRFLYLLGFMTSLLQLVPDTECHSIVKRNAWQMCNLMHRYTGRYCLNYNPYGCFCGLGQAGSQPIDASDSCCKEHDDCYGEVTDGKYCSFWSMFVGYRYSCQDDTCVCTNNAAKSSCAREVCECDLKLAQCLSKSEYNREFYRYDRSQCV